MLNRKTILSAALIAGAISLTPAAQAAEPGFYVGGGIGQGNDLVLNETSAAYKIFGGYNVNPFLGMELAYVNLGSNYTLYDSSTGNYYTGTQDGVSYELVGHLPIGYNIDIFGKVGLFNWSNSYNYVYAPSAQGTNNDYGFGLSARLAPQLWLRGEYQKFLDVNGGDVNMASVNIVYHFY